MQFEVQCDMNDCIVIMDPCFVKDMNEDILNAMNIFLDPDGETELADDFPGEDWNDVYKRETAPFRAFIDSGKLWIRLLPPCEKSFVLKEADDDKLTEKLMIASGRVVAVMASELLQCLYYPELEMELLGETELENGEYKIGSSADGMIGINRQK